jgi:type IV secretory pathway VirD2 relaxase
MIAKGTGYVKGGGARGRLSAHAKYIEYRARDDREARDDRRIFDKENDVVSQRDAVDDIMDHAHQGVAFHKIVLSPSTEEPVYDWREWTREVMADLEERQGKELHWFAVKHENTDNPHVHVVLAGSGENLETGKTEQIRIYTPDYQFLRESGQAHSDYEHTREIQGMMQDLDRQDAQIPGARDVVDQFDAHPQGRGGDRGDFDR